MSLFNKVLSSIGIGSAKVDTVLHNPELTPLDILQGSVQVTGGGSSQHINHIELHLCCNFFSEECYTDDDDNEQTRIQEHVAKLTNVRVSDSFELAAEQALSFEFELQLPAHTPLSLGKCEIWLETALDIDYALDKSDRDSLHVVPDPAQLAVLESMQQLGFALSEVECEQSAQLGGVFVQEFEFHAHGGDFKGRVDEVEMLMVNRDGHLELLVEVDRKTRGISGFFAQMLGSDERQLWIQIHHSDLNQTSELLYQAIDDHC